MCDIVGAGFDFWKGITLFLSGATAVIAFQQFDVSRNKLKLDLFDRRFALFAGARRFLTSVTRKAGATDDELEAYRVSILEADFLFEPSMAEFLRSLWSKGVELNSTDLMLGSMAPGAERTKLVQKHGDLVKALSDELPRLTEKFGPYMSFAKWRDV